MVRFATHGVLLVVVLGVRRFSWCCFIIQGWFVGAWVVLVGGWIFVVGVAINGCGFLGDLLGVFSSNGFWVGGS